MSCYSLIALSLTILYCVGSSEGISFGGIALPKVAPELFRSESSEVLGFADKLKVENEEMYALLLDLVSNDKAGWTHVVTTADGVTVQKRKMPTGSYVKEEDAAAGKKHAGVKSTGIIKAPIETVFDLFIDNDRVREYNEHIVKVRNVDVDIPKSLNPKSHWTKVTWSSSPKYGPFKARDFVSVVNYRKFNNGTCIILNRPAYLEGYEPQPSKYVRATVLLAANILTPTQNGHTHLTQIAHINPGGGADTKLVAKIANRLCARGPPYFFKNLEKAAWNSKQKKGRVLGSKNLFEGVSTLPRGVYNNKYKK